MVLRYSKTRGYLVLRNYTTQRADFAHVLFGQPRHTVARATIAGAVSDLVRLVLGFRFT